MPDYKPDDEYNIQCVWDYLNIHVSNFIMKHDVEVKEIRITPVNKMEGGKFSTKVNAVILFNRVSDKQQQLLLEEGTK